MNRRVVLGLAGQSVRHVPTGVPTLATYVLEDLAYPPEQTAQRVLGSGEATVDSLNLTTTAVAGPSQANGRRASMSATAGATIGAPALLVAPDGASELKRISEVSLNSYVEFSSPIAGVYPVGSKIYGVLLSAPFPDVAASDEDRFKLEHPFRVTWKYTLDGRIQVKPELIDWERSNASADELAGEALLWISEVYDIRLPDHLRLEVVAKHMVGEVAIDLRARSVAPERFLIGDNGRALLVARILAHISDFGWSPGDSDSATWAVEARRRYKEKLDELLIGTPGLQTAITSRSQDTSSQTPDLTHRSIFNRM